LIVSNPNSGFTGKFWIKMQKYQDTKMVREQPLSSTGSPYQQFSNLLSNLFKNVCIFLIFGNIENMLKIYFSSGKFSNSNSASNGGGEFSFKVLVFLGLKHCICS